ncbi:MAG: response regulator [bacterium]|nr:response regulator [bacterium]
MNQMNTLLIVEDEIINIGIYRELLETKYSLLVAETGESAIELMESQQPDMVLLDMMLPDIPGVELCRRFKSNEFLSHIPIIIVTTLKNKADKVSGLEAGADDYLPKPIDGTELLLKVKNHLYTKNMRDRLNDSFQNIVCINDISACLMSTFDPNYFDFKTNLHKLLKDYTSQIKDSNQLPSFIMSSVRSEKNTLDSTLYKLDGKELKILQANLSIANFENYAINDGGLAGDVIFQNCSESDGDFKNFQQKFHKEVRKQVGNITNYISYHGREVFIIAFNFKTDVNRFMAQTFKSFTLNGNFFKVIQDQLGEVKEAYNYAMNSLARAAEASDELTGAHIIRVNHYSGFIARLLNLPEKMALEIFHSGQMHDIGKVHIHPDIIRKKGKLTDDEWHKMKRHPKYGAKILGSSKYMEVARNICLGHHENSDGSGYPRRLKNDQIPIEARIVHLADVYDSLRSPRSYKPAFSHEKSISLILDGDDRTGPHHFDPKIIEIFKRKQMVFADIYQKLTAELS